MTSTVLFGVVIVPAVTGLVQVAKGIGMPSKLAPAAALLFGILASLAGLVAGHDSWIPAVVAGVGTGLSAVGLYAGTKGFLAPKAPAGPNAPVPLPQIGGHVTRPATTRPRVVKPTTPRPPRTRKPPAPPPASGTP